MFEPSTLIGTAIGWGTQNLGAIGASGFAMVGAATPTNNIALGFVAPTSGTLTGFSGWVASTAGSPLDVRACLYADLNGAPDSSGPIASSESAGIAVSTAGWYQFTLPNVAVTAGQRYHLVLKNYTASTTATFYYFSAGLNAIGGTNNPGWGYTKYQTTTGDSGWGTTITDALYGWFTLASGVHFGLPFRVAPVNRTAASMVGNLLTLPRGINAFSCIGVQIKLSKTGSPATGVYCSVNDKPTQTIPAALLNTNTYTVPLYFSEPILLYGGQEVRALIHISGTDASNYYRIAEVTVDPAAPNAIPFNMIKTLSTDGGATWANTAGTFVEMFLLGQAFDDYGSASINRRQFNSQR